MNYTIGEAAAKVQINPTTLRYYDKEGLLPFVKRNPAGIRIFKEADFEWLHLIECLKSTGMPLKDIKQFIDWYMEGDDTLEERREMFYERKKAVEEQIESLQTMLEIVNYKCWFYDKAVEEGSAEKIKELALKDMPVEIREGKEKLLEWHSK